MNIPVLVLNASYEAINICDAKRALKMIIKGVAYPEKESEYEVRSASVSIRIPHVVRLAEYVKIPRSSVRFSRKNVFLRDQYTCQYCGRRFPASMLTLDHVIPISRGGMTSWKNVVTACKSCNNKKGNRTPMEAGMMLIRKPRMPSLYIHIAKFAKAYHNSWREYLFHDND
jgi:5-methylcytosine-specific restriction endonuclease McrA